MKNVRSEMIDICELFDNMNASIKRQNILQYYKIFNCETRIIYLKQTWRGQSLK